MSKTLRNFLVGILSVCLVITAVVFLQSVAISGADEDWLQNADFSTYNDAQIARGEYLALAGNCASCHTTADGGFMAGGLAFETPFGTVYSTNITPDTETGIGAWTGAEFFRSMRSGLRPDGEHLYPVFPYTAFSKITNEDILALYAYLKSIPPVSKAAQKNDLTFPFNQRPLLAFWKAAFLDAGVYQPENQRSAAWNRGAYLVEALAHCSACHSPRNLAGAETTRAVMSGGEIIAATTTGGQRTWSAPNLTSAQYGLGMWAHEEVVAYLHTGMNSFVDTFGPMNEVILNSTRHLSRTDVDAMATYLKSLPAQSADPAPTASDRVLGMGRTLYNLHCGTCHLPTGLGDPESAPRLAGGSLVVQARDPASLINVILDGPLLPDPPLETQRRNPMESFRYMLDDEEVAALASYLRSAWGNTGGKVTADQVAAQR